MIENAGMEIKNDIDNFNFIIQQNQNTLMRRQLEISFSHRKLFNKLANVSYQQLPLKNYTLPSLKHSEP